MSEKSQSQFSTVKKGFLVRFLDPIDRLVEGMYSVLIVLTFTLTVSVVEANNVVSQMFASATVNRLFIASFGCAVAWGILDGIMYIVTAALGRGQRFRLITAIRDATSEQEGIEMITEELDEVLPSITSGDERTAFYRSMYRKVKGMASKESNLTGINREDFAGGLGIALIAFLAALPVVLPLLLVDFNPTLAVRTSNVVAFGMLFCMGFRWGRYTGVSSWKTGLSLMLVGVVMMLIAIPLGG